MFREGPLAFTSAGVARLLTYWWYAPFQPHLAGDPVWLARVVTLLALLPGFAALISVGRLAAGKWGLLITTLLYLFSTYHMFFERLALSDPLSASAISLTLYFAYRLSRRAHNTDALLTGFAAFIAFGLKATALPYFGVALAAVFTLRPSGRSWRDQLRWLAIALVTETVLTGAFIFALRSSGHNPLPSLVSHTGITDTSVVTTIPSNAAIILTDLAAYWSWPGLAIVLLATVYLLARRRFYLPLCLFAPLLVFWLSHSQDSRYYVAPASIALLSVGVAWALLIRQRGVWLKTASVGVLLAIGAFNWLPFAWTLAQNPAEATLSANDTYEYIFSDASGFGLSQTRDYLVSQNAEIVIAVMANCQGLRYMTRGSFEVICPSIAPDGSRVDELADLLAQRHAEGVYVVLEDLPYVPDTSPGELLTVIEYPAGRVTLSIYALTP